LPKAKLAIADSFYKEGGTANLTQAVQAYKDFDIFFPMLPEAAYAQLQVAMTHYKQMEKPDRDRTHASSSCTRADAVPPSEPADHRIFGQKRLELVFKPCGRACDRGPVSPSACSASWPPATVRTPLQAAWGRKCRKSLYAWTACVQIRPFRPLL